MWYRLTAFGDCAVLLPVAMVTLLWLIGRPTTRHNALLWAAALCCCVAAVALSKLAYMAWGIGIPGLSFTGFSGHTALSCALWPAVPALLIPERKVLVRRIGVGLGILLAIGIAASRLGLGVHSISEVLLGGLLGFGITGVFFKLRHATPRIGAPAWQIALTLLLPLCFCYGRTFPSQHLLRDTAIYVSGHGMVFTREDMTPRAGG